MSWWGFQKGKSAMMVIVETPDDAAYQFEHPAGGPTVIGPRWRESLGQLRYPRSCRMCFFEEGNYVDLAKRYRRYAMDTGLFVSLKEKIARPPIVKELIGTPQTRVGILTNIKSGQPEVQQDRSDRQSPAHHVRRSRQATSQIERRGLEHLVWSHRLATEGYDRQHPDELPPAPAAGGWEGMKRLADTCHELGYLSACTISIATIYTDAPVVRSAVRHPRGGSAATPPRFPRHPFRRWKEGHRDS